MITVQTGNIQRTEGYYEMKAYVSAETELELDAHRRLLEVAPELLTELRVHRKILSAALGMLSNADFVKLMDIEGFCFCARRADDAIYKATGLPLPGDLKP